MCHSKTPCFHPCKHYGIMHDASIRAASPTIGIHECVASITSMIHPPGMQVPSIHLLYCQYRIYALHNSNFVFPTCFTHSGLSVAALGTSAYSYYSCKLAGQVVGSPVNSSSLEAATRSCNHQQHSACTVDYENGDGGCTAELIGTQLSPCALH